MLLDSLEFGSLVSGERFCFGITGVLLTSADGVEAVKEAAGPRHGEIVVVGLGCLVFKAEGLGGDDWGYEPEPWGLSTKFEEIKKTENGRLVEIGEGGGAPRSHTDSQHR